MIEQTDQRTILGLSSEYRFLKILGTIFSNTTAGGGFRADNVEVALWKSPNRVRQTLNVNADVFERNFFLWMQQEFIFNPRWRLQMGLRGDYLTFKVEDHLDTQPVEAPGLPHASGYGQESILSPKFNLVFSPFENTALYLNVGSGFHSNDARNVVIAQRTEEIARTLSRQGKNDQEVEQELMARNLDPAQRGIETLPRALGGELGGRTHLSRRFVVSLAAWWFASG